MQIIDFAKEWIPQAQRLIMQNYIEESTFVSTLPVNAAPPPLDSLTENGLGVAAIEDGKLLGFLGAYGPFKPVFCTPDVSGIFSPLHAHAVQPEDRIRIWRRLYQAAGEKWLHAGASSHAITLYTHDQSAHQALYFYGFGVRCMDLIRTTDTLPSSSDWRCYELESDRQAELLPLRRMLAEHLSYSPCFMKHDPDALNQWLLSREKAKLRTFVAEKNGRVISYIDAQKEGENFATYTPGMMNICGAYCLPAYRGTGAAQAILAAMINTFRKEGFTHLGVDCESFNPTAFGFWSKHFTNYTCSVVRRIDENAVL